MTTRGPLPDPNHRRRNAPTIPTTRLPAQGRQDPAPDCPYDLGDQGTIFWHWAWALPQAAAWDDGAVYAVARRAQLEDDVASLHFSDHLDLTDLLAGADADAIRRVRRALETLKRCATGKATLEREMRELDGKLGLNPEAMARLRWTIVDDEAPEASKPKTRTASSTTSHLRAVDPGAIG
jgi:hypothetical protein